MDNFFGVYNYAYNGGGVAIGDINNDGLSDIYFTGNQVEDKLYLNKGNFEFEDITKASGILGKTSWHNGVVMADINNDGLLDIYICKGGWNDPKTLRKNLLYINQGNATFLEKGAEYGLDDSAFSTMASFFDADNDNDLDMYLMNRPKDFFIPVDKFKEMKQSNHDDYRDKLFINEGGKFIEKSEEFGIINNFGNGLGLATSDLNNDGLQDIYVANDYYESDYLYINQKGKFSNEIKNRINHTAFYGMGVDIADINNDGLEDIIELDMSPENYVRSKTNMASMNVKQYNDYLDEGFHNQYMHNMLFYNQGKGVFSDISQLSGISKTDWSWSCLASDFDNDGDRDIFITNGFKRDIWNRDAAIAYRKYTMKGINPNKTKNQIITDIVNFYPSEKLQNYIYQNNGNLSFLNRADDWGLKDLSFSNGAAFGDLDNDGDLDLVVNNIDDEAFIYENKSETINGHNYIKIKLQGPNTNPSGIGAKITIYHQDSIQYQEFKTVRGYLSSVEPVLHFGLGSIDKIDSIKVIWNTNKQSLIKNISINQTLNVTYNKSTDFAYSDQNSNSSLFKEISNITFNPKIRHTENPYNDYKAQVLLPHKLSTLGPALATGDVNNDGIEDFYFGGAKDQTSKLLLQNTNNTFTIKKQSSFENDKTHEDVYAHFFDADNDNDLDLYVVSGGNEFESEASFYTDRLYLNDGNGNFTKSSNIPEIKTSGSCIVPIDFDKDGDLDLFIGSRHIPKKYPLPASSFLLENNNGKFIDITERIAPQFKNIGMVTSAVSSNIDSDDDIELLIVGEWMKIHLFKLIDGKFVDISDQSGLEKTHGWWNHIAANDIDNDGDIDFVVGNLGLNYKFKASTQKPFYVFANDYDQNGTQDVFLAKKVNDKLVPIRGKECATEQLPHLQQKFKSYTEFANAELFDIIEKDQASSVKYKVENFASVVLINNNGKFTSKELPIEAQFSVINGILVEDFNNDGIKDLLIGGNRFEAEVETTRSDASFGLVLLGSPSGNFNSLNYIKSGIYIPYNVKSIKKIELANKKTGVLVGTNNDQLRLYNLQ